MIILQTHYNFLNFLAKLFESLNYTVQITDGPNDYGTDIIITNKNQKILVGVKVNRTKHRPPLTNALLQLHHSLNNSNASNGILIITSIVEPSVINNLFEEYRIFIWDRSILFYLTRDNYELRKELEEILSELKQSGEEDIYDGVFEIKAIDIKNIWLKRNQTSISFSPVTKGATLCAQLNNIPSGKKDSNRFEKKCEEILQYLFDTDLGSWSPQNSTEDTLHRFDLIARIISQNDFWRFIARDFKTRFVIFEFKNYFKCITQSQIYSTEKYLYTTALRTFAIIISKEGADNNAKTAMKGSLRESGKLIICLSSKEICIMLNMKDKGDDPNTYLSDKIDRILMQLSR